MKFFFKHLYWAEEKGCRVKRVEVSSVILSARSTVSPVAITIFTWNLFCFARYWKVRSHNLPCVKIVKCNKWLWVGRVDLKIRSCRSKGSWSGSPLYAHCRHLRNEILGLQFPFKILLDNFKEERQFLATEFLPVCCHILVELSGWLCCNLGTERLKEKGEKS